MNDHDLDDLVIDTEPTKSHVKTKNPLTLFALVIIILILGIIFNNNFHQDTPNPELLEENMSDFIAPELQLQNANNHELSSLEDPEEAEIALPDAKEEAFSLKTLIDNKPKTPLEKMQVIEMPILTTQRTATAEKIVSTEAEKPIQKPVKEEVVETIDESSQEEKAIKNKIEKDKEDEKTIVEPKPKPKPKPKPREVKHSSSNPYYIQVGAFNSTPSKRLLSVITSTGFKYLITKPNRSGAKKLLIGPYYDKASVNKALGTVQIRINKNAYVIRK